MGYLRMVRLMESYWFKHHFLVPAPPTQPPLLLLDRHAYHYKLSILRMAAEEEITIFCLPPHVTHLLQSLNKGLFVSLKSHWTRECHSFYAQNPGKVACHKNVMGMFKEA